MKLFGAFVAGPSKQCPSDPLIAQLRPRHGRCDLRDCRSLSAFIVAHAGRSVVAKLRNILITMILRAPYRQIETIGTLRLLTAVTADIQTKLKRIVTLAKANNSTSHGICEIEFAGMISAFQANLRARQQYETTLLIQAPFSFSPATLGWEIRSSQNKARRSGAIVQMAGTKQ